MSSVHMDRIRRGCVELVGESELASRLASGRKLRVKLGVDPTSPDLHLGHTVVLRKLRLFQDLGHTAVLIIGDFTASVGDPSGRDDTRPVLTTEQIRANARTYEAQAFKVLDPARTELRFNSEWLQPFMERDLLGTLRRCTVQQLLAREDFQKRLKNEDPISLLEILYPLLQGQDSVAVRADVELGGNDQLFNLLMGRQMQKDAGQDPQVILTTPLLVGLDGVKKMSKSYGNSIALADAPREMFGRVMKLSDDAMASYYELLTDEDRAAVAALHPMEAKKRLAGLLTGRFHGEEAGAAERRFFDETFSQKKLPENVESVSFPAGDPAPVSAALAALGLVKSRKEAQRLLAQGAVSADGVKLEGDPPFASLLGKTVKIGKHRFIRPTAGGA
ncbi:MAG TPA: tyrosine--tRNA ligase [Elusimicrobia bacterium]|nr:tyrosine--tRNA ligase [Elusimicrobiota bacterium]